MPSVRLTNDLSASSNLNLVVPADSQHHILENPSAPCHYRQGARVPCLQITGNGHWEMHPAMCYFWHGYPAATLRQTNRAMEESWFNIQEALTSLNQSVWYEL
jgi:hypothetical protein